LRNLKIQYIRISKTIHISSHIFHSTFSVTAEQSGSEPRQDKTTRGHGRRHYSASKWYGDPTRTCVQASPNYGRGRPWNDMQM